MAVAVAEEDTAAADSEGGLKDDGGDGGLAALGPASSLALLAATFSSRDPLGDNCIDLAGGVESKDDAVLVCDAGETESLPSSAELTGDSLTYLPTVCIFF